MRADTRTTGEIKTALQEFRDAYAGRDMEGLLACFESDADVVLYGTGTDEKRVGLDQIRRQAERDWAQSETATMTFDWTSISAAGPVAWVAADGAFDLKIDGHDIHVPARATFVLERRDGRWLIAQSHFSTPATEQQQGQSF